MLLFINSPRPLAVWACYFNTSHVTVYPCSAKTSLPDLYHFNTSHVTVYLLHPPNNPYPLSISIHLMLLFITCILRLALCFNLISIHLMLLFINSYLTDEQVTT